MDQTKIKDIFTRIKRKKWTWARHAMQRTDNRWTARVTEWQPRDGKGTADRELDGEMRQDILQE